MKKNLLKLGILLSILFIGLKSVDAASYTISASSTNITKGGSVTLTIKGSDITGRFNVSTSNASIVAISEDRAWIENNTYRITLSALNAGSATITVTPSGVSDSSGNQVSLGAKSITINVSLPREKSKDNNLKSLSIEGYEISPEFSKDVQVYNAVIPEGTKKINIKAQTNESHATIAGTGEHELTEGINSINIIVTSETGSEKIYTINAEVKDNNPIEIQVNNKKYTLIKVKDNLTKPDTFEETVLTINGYEIPAFTNKKANLNLVGLKDESGTIKLFIYNAGKYSPFNELNLNKYLLIPADFDKELDYIKTSVTINGTELEAYKYSENTDFVIINAKNLVDGKTSLYLYDTNNETAQIFDETFIKETNTIIKNYTYIIIAFASALVIMLILIFSLLHSLKKKQKKINKFLQKQEAKIEATRKLNDVVDEVKKITESDKKTKNKDKDFSLTEMISTINTEEPENNDTKKKKDKKNNQNKSKEEVKIQEIQVNPNDEIKKVMEDDEEVYDLFADDKKKKKKK